MSARRTRRRRTLSVAGGRPAQRQADELVDVGDVDPRARGRYQTYSRIPVWN
jgi:hypothetical protein